MNREKTNTVFENRIRGIKNTLQKIEKEYNKNKNEDREAKASDTITPFRSKEMLGQSHQPFLLI